MVIVVRCHFLSAHTDLFSPLHHSDLVVQLRRARNKTAFKGTETLLNRLIVTTIETGAITAGFALVTLVLFKVLPNAYYFLTTSVSVPIAPNYSYAYSYLPGRLANLSSAKCKPRVCEHFDRPR